jgi:ribonucleoside-diphosphate reductase alpha chain
MKFKALRVVDSMDGIFDSLMNAVMLAVKGHHIFLDFSELRKAGSFVTDTSGIASGPVSFMRIFDDAFKHANLRVKLLFYLNPDHEDYNEYMIEDFKYAGKYYGKIKPERIPGQLGI